MNSRGDLDAGTLLRIVLGLVIVWLALEVVGALFGVVRQLFGVLWALVRPLFALAILALVVLWLLDRL